MKEQPINNVTWLHRDNLSPNMYNPNNVAKPEMALLKESIMTDGWLFPIVVFDKSINIVGITDNDNLNLYTIIDGYHRYTISKDLDIYQLTDGMLPCLVLNPTNPLATTIRLNRAKGTHAVLKMAEIVQREIGNKKPIEQIMIEYGMEKEEVIRLASRLGIFQTEIVTDTNWSNSWSPK